MEQQQHGQRVLQHQSSVGRVSAEEACAVATALVFYYNMLLG
jgi:hypothetical protein